MSVRWVLRWELVRSKMNILNINADGLYERETDVVPLRV